MMSVLRCNLKNKSSGFDPRKFEIKGKILFKLN
jgi:hypothetical protein